MELNKNKKRVVTIIGRDGQDSLNMDIEAKINTMLSEGYMLESCNITSSEKYSTIYCSVILMFKPIEE